MDGFWPRYFDLAGVKFSLISESILIYNYHVNLFASRICISVGTTPCTDCICPLPKQNSKNFKYVVGIYYISVISSDGYRDNYGITVITP